MFAAVDLVNELAVESSDDRNAVAPDDPEAAVRRVLAVDPPSLDQLVSDDVPGFRALAADLHTIFELVGAGDVASAATLLNHMLTTFPSQPHLALEDGVWRLHHHPVDAELVPMWTAICAEALARLIGNGQGHRMGVCERAGCGRVFVDVSKNASRAFCSTACQNRVKAAAFRARAQVVTSHSSNVGPARVASGPGSSPPSS
ncbi:MAG TPA: CGNR zinc finger domain-containing protein [Acidimicrobiales bacterium]